MRIIADARRSMAKLVGFPKVFVVVSNVEFATEVLCVGCAKTMIEILFFTEIRHPCFLIV